MEEGSDPAREGVTPALKRVLRPLVKALIAKGVTAPALYSTLKELYVQVARDSFALEGKPPTDSRVSVLTGVHRKDVRVFRSRPREAESAGERRVTTMTTVIGRWLGDPDTTAADGTPLKLPRTAQQGPSFDSLVSSVSTDVRPRTILDELRRKGIVELDEDSDEVGLRVEALLPRDADERFHFFARNIGDHVAAAVENVLTEEGPAPFLERAVFYNKLSGASVDEIEARARALALELLTELNRLGYARQSADARKEDGGGEDANQRFRFGVYFFREGEGTEDEG